MNPFIVGDWWIVAGQGPLKIVEVEKEGLTPRSPLTSVAMVRPGTGRWYWAMSDQLVRMVDVDYLDTWEADKKSRGIADSSITEIREWLAKNPVHFGGAIGAPACGQLPKRVRVTTIRKDVTCAACLLSIDEEETVLADRRDRREFADRLQWELLDVDGQSK